jgi:hypothetical protein
VVVQQIDTDHHLFVPEPPRLPLPFGADAASDGYVSDTRHWPAERLAGCESLA